MDGSNLTLTEMDTKQRSQDFVASADKARRRKIVAPQIRQVVTAQPNRVTRFAHRNTLELAASLVTVVVIGGGIASAALLA